MFFVSNAGSEAAMMENSPKNWMYVNFHSVVLTSYVSRGRANRKAIERLKDMLVMVSVLRELRRLFFD